MVPFSLDCALYFGKYKCRYSLLFSMGAVPSKIIHRTLVSVDRALKELQDQGFISVTKSC